MIPRDALRKITNKAKERSAAAESGGLEKKLNDLESYGQSAGVSGAAFAIAHIPIVGPALAQAFTLASGAGITKMYEKWLADANTPKERIGYALFLLEKSMAASVRQSYNTVVSYDKKSSVGMDANCKDCQEAFREAYATALASNCIGDLESAVKLLKKLTEDLETEVRNLNVNVQRRVTNLEDRLESFRDKHKNSKCLGAEACYYIPVAMPGSEIGDKELDL